MSKVKRCLENMQESPDSAMWLYVHAMTLQNKPDYLDDLAKAFLHHYDLTQEKLYVHNAMILSFISGNNDVFKTSAKLYNGRGIESSLILGLTAYKRWENR